MADKVTGSTPSSTPSKGTTAVDAAGGGLVGATSVGGSEALAIQTDLQMTAMNAIQNQMAIKSMEMQILATSRSMMVQAVRDLCKDAKDTIKDQGEAGHKP